MARVQIVTPFDVPAFDGFFGNVTVASPTQYVVEADGNRADYQGSFSYPNGTVHGIINTASVTVGGEIKFFAADVYFSAEVLAQFSGSGRIQEAYQQILSSSDLIVGSYGADTIPGFAGADVISGAGGNDVINGNRGQDLVNGNIGNDIVSGGRGNDSVYGGQGNDTVYGDLGNDLISGDKGNDVLTGGAGADKFVFSSGRGADIITDFSFNDGDRLGLAGRTYNLTTADDGSAALVIQDGDVIILQGVTQAEFSAAYMA